MNEIKLLQHNDGDFLKSFIDVFIDSWGGFWEACKVDDEGAEAFGPTGISRQVVFVEHDGHIVSFPAQLKRSPHRMALGYSKLKDSPSVKCYWSNDEDWQYLRVQVTCARLIPHHEDIKTPQGVSLV